MSHTPGPCDCYTDTYGDIQRCPLHAAAQELLEALKAITPSMPRVDAKCHVGICSQEECSNCQRIHIALAAIAKATGGAL